MVLQQGVNSKILTFNSHNSNKILTLLVFLVFRREEGSYEQPETLLSTDVLDTNPEFINDFSQNCSLTIDLVMLVFFLVSNKEIFIIYY